MTRVAICVPSGAEPAAGVTDALGGRGVVVVADTVWEARRRALAECDTDVIAFVDGDVVVPPGWLERLDDAWADAGQEIAAIGGPVRLAKDADGADAGVASALDLGDAALDLDPLEQTLIGGNLSFRVGPLRGVGGFGPTVDRRDARDWLSEEHEAQRQIGHWGWLARYDPALAAERLTGWKGALRGGRFRYGMRLGIARGRSPAVAARTLGPAAAGAILARIQRKPELGRERGARAAENAGVLLAPILESRAWRRRGQWPDADAARGDANPTRGDADVVRANPRSRRRGGGAPLILLYHRIADVEADPLGLCVAPAHFREQLDVLRERFEIVSLDAIADGLAAGSLPAGTAAVTFDDGYADNVPALTDVGVPATLFVATAHVAAGRPFFWDEAARLFREAPGARDIELDGKRHRVDGLTAFHRLVQPRSAAAIASALDQLRAAADAAPSTQPPPLMKPADVTTLANRGIAIGAHTRNHVNLAHQADDVLVAEVEGSRDDVAEWTGARPRGFSYPFGLPRHDVDARARRTVEAAGFDYAVVNQPVAVLPGTERFAIPRVFAPDLGGVAFRDWLQSKLTGFA